MPLSDRGVLLWYTGANEANEWPDWAFGVLITCPFEELIGFINLYTLRSFECLRTNAGAPSLHEYVCAAHQLFGEHACLHNAIRLHYVEVCAKCGRVVLIMWFHVASAER